MAESRSKKKGLASPHENRPELRATLDRLADRLAQGKAMRPGSIMFRFSGEGGGDFCLDCTSRGASLAEGAPRDAGAPLIEVIGDARVIRSVLEGRKNARAAFLAGGFRVRGDLNYLSDLAMELGILEEPI